MRQRKLFLHPTLILACFLLSSKVKPPQRLTLGPLPFPQRLCSCLSSFSTPSSPGAPSPTAMNMSKSFPPRKEGKKKRNLLPLLLLHHAESEASAELSAQAPPTSPSTALQLHPGTQAAGAWVTPVSSCKRTCYCGGICTVAIASC